MSDYPASFVVPLCNDLLAHINACHEVLERLEWSATDGYWPQCPECSGIDRDLSVMEDTPGHTPDCPLKACLDGKP